MTSAEFKNIAQTIPKQPGVYKYFSAENELLYVGKAKNLLKRISSYFLKNQQGYKTHELVKRIARIEFILVDSEQDAFFLENSLIKEFQPRFNINLKDDKTYPLIVIKNEPFPRVFFTRKIIDDGSVYLGPYTSVKKVRELLEFIRMNIPLRNCSLNLTAKNIAKKKFKVCLEYHLGNCKGPCEGLQSEEEYNEDLEQLKNLLKGNLNPVILHFKKEMKRYANELDFEKAELVKKKIEFLKTYKSSSVIVNPKLSEVDVFTIVREKENAFVNYLMVRNGTIVQSMTLQPEYHLDETDEEILAFTILQQREKFNSQANELVLQFPIPLLQNELRITVPKAGDKKKLLDLSMKNADYYITEIKNRARLQLDRNDSKDTILSQLQQDLRLPDLPVHIECFDNSHFQGSYPVSAMVCFKHGKPSKTDYRLFNVKSVKGIDDFATMKEAVYRRYKRVRDENLSWPQLVIVDGGKGQLNMAAEALTELNVSGKTTLIGLAKNEEEIFFTADKDSQKLPLKSSSLHLLRKIRDEVHRFGITFHRKKRSEGTFSNSLEKIQGIGPATAELLLKEFRSVKNIKNQPVEKIEKLIGKHKSDLVRNFLKEN